MKPVTEVLYQCYEVFCLPGTWLQNTYDDGYRVCAAGAIDTVTSSIRLRNKARTVLRLVIGEKYIGTWNDSSRRSQTQVREALLKAALLSEGP